MIISILSGGDCGASGGGGVAGVVVGYWWWCCGYSGDGDSLCMGCSCI